MAVKIRLKRFGKLKSPFYRVVVMDSRAKRDGRAIEEIGKYHPTAEPSLIEIDSERTQYWLGVGAQPTEQVAALLKVTGDWQKYKGLPGTEGTLKVGEARPDKKALYEAAAKSAMDAPKEGATTARRKKSDDAPKADTAKAADAPRADAKADDAPRADAKADDAPRADAKADDAPQGKTPQADAVADAQQAEAGPAEA